MYKIINNKIQFNNIYEIKNKMGNFYIKCKHFKVPVNHTGVR